MVSSRLTKNEVTITPMYLAERILKGYSFTVSAFKYLNGKYTRKIENFKSMDIVGLDFDGGITPKEVFNKSRALGLEPNFMYTSYSDTETLRKFRVIYVLNYSVTNLRIADILINALMEIFPECDGQCKDVARMFFGGKELLYNNYYATVSIEQVINAFCTNEINKDNKHYSRKIENFCKTLGINMVNKIPLLIEEQSTVVAFEDSGEKPSPLFINNRDEDIFPHKTISLSDNVFINIKGKSTIKYNISNSTDKTKRDLIQHFNPDDFYNNCPLFEIMSEGKLYPYDNEWMGMCLSLLKYEGGEKELKRLLELAPIDSNIKEIYKSKITYYKKRYVAEMSCEKFCPFKDKSKSNIQRQELREEVKQGLNVSKVCSACRNYGVLPSHCFSKRGRITKLEEKEKKSLTVAEIEYKENLHHAYHTEKDADIIILKYPTGLGKSVGLGLLGVKTGTVIATPTHNLNKEIYEKLNINNSLLVKDLDLGIDMSKEYNYPSLEYFCKYLTENIRFMRESGAYGLVRKAIRDFNKNVLYLCKDRLKEAKERVRICNDYIKALNACTTTNKPIFCTHAKALNLNNININTMIFDEDILKTGILKTVELNVEEIKNTIDVCEDMQTKVLINQLKNLLKKLEEIPEGGVIQVGGLEIPTKEINHYNNIFARKQNSNKKCRNLVDVLSVKRIVKVGEGQYQGMYVNKFPSKAKIVILSATANERLYSALFPKKKIKVYDSGLVESVGNVIFHYDSMSKNKFNDDISKCIEKVKIETNNINCPLITYMKYKSYFQKEGYDTSLHFYNCTGYDSYKGKDIIVVGTPHAKESTYLLIASFMLDNPTYLSKFNYVETIRNGFRFYFNTVNGDKNDEDSELLKEIQFYLIESELYQAVGRARTLREDCTVHLFSSLPLKGCQLYKEII